MNTKTPLFMFKSTAIMINSKPKNLFIFFKDRVLIFLFRSRTLNPRITHQMAPPITIPVICFNAIILITVENPKFKLAKTAVKEINIAGLVNARKNAIKDEER